MRRMMLLLAALALSILTPAVAAATPSHASLAQCDPCCDHDDGGCVGAMQHCRQICGAILVPTFVGINPPSLHQRLTSAQPDPMLSLVLSPIPPPPRVSGH